MTSTMRFDKWENSLGQPYGTVLQVVQTVDTNVTTFSSSSSDTFFAYNNLNTTVVPRSANSRFLVRFQVNAGASIGSMRMALNINGVTQGTTTLGGQRASSNSIYVSDGLPGNASIYALTGEHLFQNSGLSNVVINFELFKQDGGRSIFINRAHSFDDTSRGRPASWVTIMEIAQ